MHALEKYKAQATANGVDDLVWLTAGQVLGLEPEVRCVRALLSPSTGIIDSHEYMLALQADIEAAGGSVVLNTNVTGVRPPAAVSRWRSTARRPCAAGSSSTRPGCGRRSWRGASRGCHPATIPAPRFAVGHYFTLQGRSPFHRLVYPVAEKAGLGIHVTLDLAGAARFGPDVKWIDGIDYSFDESRRPAFAAAIRRYYPALDEVEAAARLHRHPAEDLRARRAGGGLPDPGPGRARPRRVW